MKRLLLLLFVVSAIPNPCQARTFHAIGLFSTGSKMGDDGLRYSVQTDLDAFKRLSSAIAAGIGYKLDTAILSGENFTIVRAQDLLLSVNVLPGDMVFLYVDCYGFRTTEQKSTFPIALINNIQPATDLGMSSLNFEDYCRQWIVKEPKLFVGVIDACNSGSFPARIPEPAGSWAFALRPPRSDSIVNGRLKDLFMNVKGSILISASSPNEDSYYNGSGSEFSSNYFIELEHALSSSSIVSWENIFLSTKAQVIKNIRLLVYANRLKKGTKQTPFMIANIRPVPPMEEYLPDPPYLPQLSEFDKLIQRGISFYNEQQYNRALPLFQQASSLRTYSTFAKFYIYLCQVPLNQKSYKMILLPIIGELAEDEQFAAYLEDKKFAMLQFFIAVSYFKGTNGFRHSWKNCKKWLFISNRNGFAPAAERILNWGG